MSQLLSKRILIPLSVFALTSFACSTFASPDPTAEPPAEPAVVEVTKVIEVTKVVEVEETTDAVDEAAAPLVDPNQPVKVSGTAEITFVLFESYLTETFVMLEDLAGFVNRDFEYEQSEESQVLGPLFSTDEDSIYEYTLNLPIEPVAQLVDVDNNGAADTGVQIFAATVQANLLDGPFLGDNETGGWSSTWTSLRIDEENEDEIVGGLMLVWAPDANQGFPTDFGPDGKLFTEDDPTAPIAQGYSVVNLDETPFNVYTEREPVLPLYEGDVAAKDYTEMGYMEAFDALFAKASVEYPFTEMKGIDWDALYAEYAPRMQEADEKGRYDLYFFTLRDFANDIPDGHVGVQGDDRDYFRENVIGGLGIGLTELTNGDVIVSTLVPNAAAANAGIQLGAQIFEWNGVPIEQAIDESVPLDGPYSATHVERLEKILYLPQGQLDTEVTIGYVNPDLEAGEVTLTRAFEVDAFLENYLYAGIPETSAPVEYEIVGQNTGYIRIWSMSDDLNLTLRLIERAVADFDALEVDAIIFDMRTNGGGSPLGGHIAGFFTNEELELARGYYYSEAAGEFTTHGPADTIEPDDSINYDGEVYVLVSPGCASACENVAYAIGQTRRATIVGHYPTNGIFGEVGRGQYDLPDDVSFQIPTGMDIAPDGTIIIEGTGVVPDETVPVTMESVFYEGDYLLDYVLNLIY